MGCGRKATRCMISALVIAGLAAAAFAQGPLTNDDDAGPANPTFTAAGPGKPATAAAPIPPGGPATAAAPGTIPAAVPKAAVPKAANPNPAATRSAMPAAVPRPTATVVRPGAAAVPPVFGGDPPATAMPPDALPLDGSMRTAPAGAMTPAMMVTPQPTGVPMAAPTGIPAPATVAMPGSVGMMPTQAAGMPTTSMRVMPGTVPSAVPYGYPGALPAGAGVPRQPTFTVVSPAPGATMGGVRGMGVAVPPGVAVSPRTTTAMPVMPGGSVANFPQPIATAPPVAMPPPIAIPPPVAQDEDAPTTVASDAPSLDERMDTCTDVAPGTRHTCEQQRMFGKCDAEYMIRYNYCAKTCGRQPCKMCEDIPPTSEFNCTQQASFGKCNEPWMTEGGYCARTCGRIPCPPLESDMQEASNAYARSGGKPSKNSPSDFGGQDKAPEFSIPKPPSSGGSSDSKDGSKNMPPGKQGEDFIAFPGPQKRK